MKLLNDRVLIKKIAQVGKEVGGLIIPESFKEQEYEVLELGNKCKALKVGDRIVLYDQAPKIPFYDNYLIRESIGIKVIL